MIPCRASDAPATWLHPDRLAYIVIEKNLMGKYGFIPPRLFASIAINVKEVLEKKDTFLNLAILG